MALFVQFDGITGESRDAEHTGWSDVVKLNWNVARSTAGSSGAVVAHGRGRVAMEDVAITKPYDSASVQLLHAMMDNQILAIVKLHDTATYGDGARRMFLEIELRRALVTSRRCEACSTGTQMPTEELTLSFEYYAETYLEYDANGQQRNAMSYEWQLQEGDRA